MNSRPLATAPVERNLRIALNGAMGRMGRVIAGLVEETPDFLVTAAWEREGHPGIGSFLPGSGVRVSEPMSTRDWDVVVDFAGAEGLGRLVEAWPDSEGALVSGSTGLDAQGRAALAVLSRRIPVLHSPNMSLGVAVLKKLLEEACRLLTPGFDVELMEMHHRRKADAPSGTALSLLETLRTHWKGPLSPVMGRNGLEGPRKEGELGVAVLRGGDVVGEHEVFFAGVGETLTLKHQALSRSVFAAGALEAARWIVGQPAGLYGMEAVLDAPRV